MTEILELAKPFEYQMPVESQNILTEMEEYLTLDNLSSISRYAGERAFISKIISLALDIKNEQGPNLKKPIPITPSQLVISRPNCTDNVSSQIFVCQDTTVQPYATFDGKHASVFAKTRMHGYWTFPNMGSSPIFSGEHEVDKENTFGNVVFNSLDQLDNCSGALIWKRTDKEKASLSIEDDWTFEMLYSEAIRQETAEIRQAQDSGAFNNALVIVNSPLSLRMLRAIDILEALKPNRKAEDIDSKAFEAAKIALKHLVPKLRNN
jgi:hypothetical protein